MGGWIGWVGLTGDGPWVKEIGTPGVPGCLETGPETEDREWGRKGGD